MSRFDIELLFIFDEIYKSRNVTRAAENLGLPQSTVSIGLGKLRTHFGDRLFARTSKGMEPTPRAQNAVQDVRAAIAAWQHALADQPVFDPAASTREFAICMTDISEIVLLPTLLNHLQQIGPGITLDVSKIATDTPERLEGGEVDLAVGFMPHLESGFYQQKLFDQHFVCLVSSSHPRIRDSITVEQFLAGGAYRSEKLGHGPFHRGKGTGGGWRAAAHRAETAQLPGRIAHRRRNRVHRHGTLPLRAANAGPRSVPHPAPARGAAQLFSQAALARALP